MRNWLRILMTNKQVFALVFMNYSKAHCMWIDSNLCSMQLTALLTMFMVHILCLYWLCVV